MRNALVLELFFATRNAVLIKNAEEYYRKMYHADAITWNIRDCHMADTVHALIEFLAEKNPNVSPKVVIWVIHILSPIVSGTYSSPCLGTQLSLG